jgi:hypothetical protein
MPGVPETIKKMPSTKPGGDGTSKPGGDGTSSLSPPLRPGQAPAVITPPAATPAVVPNLPANDNNNKSPF